MKHDPVIYFVTHPSPRVPRRRFGGSGVVLGHAASERTVYEPCKRGRGGVAGFGKLLPPTQTISLRRFAIR